MAYRDDREAARLYRDQLWKQKQAELAAVPRGLLALYRRRAARAASGIAGSLGGAALLLAGALALLLTKRRWDCLVQDGSLTAILLASWVLAGLVYGAAHALAPWLLLRPLRRALAPTQDPHADIARMERLVPRAELHAHTVARERGGLRWPLVALSLLAPLSLHLGIGLFASLHDLLSPRPLGGVLFSLLRDFDRWIAMSVLLVGLSHLVLVGFAWRFSTLAQRCPTEELERRLGWYGWKALGVAIPSALISLIFLLELKIPPRGYEITILLILLTIVTVTGLTFVPLMFRLLRRRLAREREALAASGPAGA
jgi:hypothetical protein